MLFNSISSLIQRILCGQPPGTLTKYERKNSGFHILSFHCSFTQIPINRVYSIFEKRGPLTNSRLHNFQWTRNIEGRPKNWVFRSNNKDKGFTRSQDAQNFAPCFKYIEHSFLFMIVHLYWKILPYLPCLISELQPPSFPLSERCELNKYENGRWPQKNLK